MKRKPRRTWGAWSKDYLLPAGYCIAVLPIIYTFIITYSTWMNH